MSTRKKALLALCVALAALAWAYVTGSQYDQLTRYSSSTYSSGPWGCKALYVVLQELHIPVKRFRQSFRRLQSHRGVLVITGPLRVPIRAREKVALEQWIKEGNRLIVCDGPLSSPFSRIRGTDASHNAESIPLQRLRSSSRFLRLYLTEFPDSPRKGLSVQLPHLDASAQISVSGDARWKRPPEDWATVIKDKTGPVLISKKMGKGSIFALADVTLASNAHLSDEQNLRLMLALLLGEGRHQEILFDEYHQGHVAEQSLWTYAGTSIFAWALVQGILGVGLFFFSKRGQYAGRYRSLAPQTGRSSLEYVDSMAGVYESCKAGPIALEAMLNRFLGRLSRRTGVPLKKLIRNSPNRVAALALDNEDELIDLVRRCNRAATAGRETPEALALAQQLASAGARIRGFDKT